MVDLEDPQPIQQIVTAVREGIEPSAQNHVLAHPGGGRPLHDVLGKPGPHTHPAAECRNERRGQLGLQTFAQRQPFPARQAGREIVVNDPRLGFLTMNGPGNRRQHRSAARAPVTVPHTGNGSDSVPGQPQSGRAHPRIEP